MDTLWPWLATAALGALHGMNPATGWGLAAAWGLRTHDHGIPLRTVLPLATGHLASVALVAATAVWGLPLARPVLLAVAGGLCAVVVLAHLRGHTAPPCIRRPAGHAGLALWSFGTATAHGAGLMLVPALAPLCLGGGAAGGGAASTPLLLALAALGVHTLAMLAASAAMAAAACRGVQGATRWLQRHKRRACRPVR